MPRSANLPVSFGAVFLGGLLIRRGFDNVKSALASGGSGGSASASSGSVPGTPAGGFDPNSWAKALISALGVPDTPANEQALVSWERAEGGHWNNSATYNPLNTTQTAPGSHVMAGGSGAGVQAYSSWQEGLQATVQTLNNGNYGGILAALKSGSDPNAVKQAVISSPWGTTSIP